MSRSLGWMVDDKAGQPFVVGQRVIVTGGYDQDPEWLAGGAGYSGILRELTAKWAVVELEDELVLRAAAGLTLVAAVQRRSVRLSKSRGVGSLSRMATSASSGSSHSVESMSASAPNVPS